MRHIAKIRIIFGLLLLNLWAGAHATLLADPDITLHDLEPHNSGFRVIGKDAYMIMRPDVTTQTAAFIEISIGVSNSNPEHETIGMELFFKPLASAPESASQLTLFDPLYRIQFFVDKRTLTADKGTFLLPLPTPMLAADLDLVRLDIDHCKACTIELLSHPKFVSTTDSTSLPIIKPRRVFNGLRQVPYNGFEIPIDDWIKNDLERRALGYVATGEDPYLISPFLDLTTTNLGGMVVRLKALSSTNALLDFQLFYATEKHGFIEDASISARIQPKDNSELVLVIPMPFLSEEQPVRNLLKRVRLDLPSNVKVEWQVSEISMLSKQQLKEKQNLIPTQIVTRKLQRASTRTLIRGSVTKLLSDLWFLLSYLALLITTALLFWRAYRK